MKEYRLGPNPLVANGDKTWRVYRASDDKFVGTIRLNRQNDWHAVTPLATKSRYISSERGAAGWLINAMRKTEAKLAVKRVEARGFGARGAL